MRRLGDDARPLTPDAGNGRPAPADSARHCARLAARPRLTAQRDGIALASQDAARFRCALPPGVGEMGGW